MSFIAKFSTKSNYQHFHCYHRNIHRLVGFNTGLQSLCCQDTIISFHLPPFPSFPSPSRYVQNAMDRRYFSSNVDENIQKSSVDRLPSRVKVVYNSNNQIKFVSAKADVTSNEFRYELSLLNMNSKNIEFANIDPIVGLLQICTQRKVYINRYKVITKSIIKYIQESGKISPADLSLLFSFNNIIKDSLFIDEISKHLQNTNGKEFLEQDISYLATGLQTLEGKTKVEQNAINNLAKIVAEYQGTWSGYSISYAYVGLALLHHNSKEVEKYLEVLQHSIKTYITSENGLTCIPNEYELSRCIYGLRSLKVSKQRNQLTEIVYLLLQRSRENQIQFTMKYVYLAIQGFKRFRCLPNSAETRIIDLWCEIYGELDLFVAKTSYMLSDVVLILLSVHIMRFETEPMQNLLRIINQYIKSQNLNSIHRLGSNLTSVFFHSLHSIKGETAVEVEYMNIISNIVKVCQMTYKDIVSSAIGFYSMSWNVECQNKMLTIFSDSMQMYILSIQHPNNSTVQNVNYAVSSERVYHVIKTFNSSTEFYRICDSLHNFQPTDIGLSYLSRLHQLLEMKFDVNTFRFDRKYIRHLMRNLRNISDNSPEERKFIKYITHVIQNSVIVNELHLFDDHMNDCTLVSIVEGVRSMTGNSKESQELFDTLANYIDVNGNHVLKFRIYDHVVLYNYLGLCKFKCDQNYVQDDGGEKNDMNNENNRNNYNVSVNKLIASIASCVLKCLEASVKGVKAHEVISRINSENIAMFCSGMSCLYQENDSNDSNVTNRMYSKKALLYIQSMISVLRAYYYPVALQEESNQNPIISENRVVPMNFNISQLQSLLNSIKPLNSLNSLEEKEYIKTIVNILLSEHSVLPNKFLLDDLVNFILPCLQNMTGQLETEKRLFRYIIDTIKSSNITFDQSNIEEYMTSLTHLKDDKIKSELVKTFESKIKN